jgi:hypothetical protein
MIFTICAGSNVAGTRDESAASLQNDINGSLI